MKNTTFAGTLLLATSLLLTTPPIYAQSTRGKRQQEERRLMNYVRDEQKCQVPNSALEQEVRRFFTELGATIADNSPSVKGSPLDKFISRNFIFASGQANASVITDGDTAIIGRLVLLFDPKGPVATGEQGKLWIRRRGLNTCQNDNTVVATYDTVYYRELNGQREYKAREREMSVFVRRQGKLVWVANYVNNFPDRPFNEVPRGWQAVHVTPFRIGYDVNVKHGGDTSAWIEQESNTPPEKGVVLSQSFSPQNYRGKRVRLTGYVKAENVTGDAQIQFKADETALFVGNPERGPIQGTTDWQSYSVTLEVPPDAIALQLGVMLRGAGKIWIDDFSLQIIEPVAGTKPTPIKERHPFVAEFSREMRRLEKLGPTKPVNLEFEDQ
jgi:hypothetical protein